MLLFKDTINEMKNLGGYSGFCANQADNFMQSIVAFLTFLAYTNETRFNWAYPPSSAKKEDVMPTPTIKLATSIAAICYLVATVPFSNNQVRKLNLSGGDWNDGPGTSVGDSVSRKFMFVCIAFALLTAGGKKFFYLDPVEDSFNMKLKQDSTGRDSKYLISDRWFKGFLLFVFLTISCVGLPGFLGQSNNGKKDLLVLEYQLLLLL